MPKEQIAEMKDFRDQILVEGDTVAYISGYNGGKIYLAEGIVIGFTKTMVKVGNKHGGLGYGSNIKPTRLTKIESKGNR